MKALYLRFRSLILINKTNKDQPVSRNIQYSNEESKEMKSKEPDEELSHQHDQQQAASEPSQLNSSRSKFKNKEESSVKKSREDMGIKDFDRLISKHSFDIEPPSINKQKVENSYAKIYNRNHQSNKKTHRKVNKKLDFKKEELSPVNHKTKDECFQIGQTEVSSKIFWNQWRNLGYPRINNHCSYRPISLINNKHKSFSRVEEDKKRELKQKKYEEDKINF